jgi:hypothetical protein
MIVCSRVVRSDCFRDAPLQILHHQPFPCHHPGDPPLIEGDRRLRWTDQNGFTLFHRGNVRFQVVDFPANMV